MTMSADKLHRWAIDTMKYKPQGRHVHSRIPAVHDFRNVCRGQSMDIWKFLVENVHPAQSVKTIKGNIALKQQHSSTGYKVGYKRAGAYSHERSQLLEARKQLAAELQSIKNSVQLVEKDLDRWQHSLLETEKSADQIQNSIQNAQRKAQLLKVYSQVSQDQVATYNEYKKRLQVKTNSHTTSKSQDSYFSKPAYGEGDKSIESACTKSVRECCETVRAFLHHLLKGEFGADKATVEKQRDRLWTRVEHVLQLQPAGNILSSLVLLTQDAAFNIRDQTVAINIAEDAMKLRFKYNNVNGQLTDFSDAPSNVKSVHQLVEAEQMSHIERFVETERTRNQAWKVHRELESLKAEYTTKRERKYSGHPGSSDLAKKCFEVNLHTAEARATLKVLQEIASDFKQSISQATREKEELLFKFKRIQDFECLVDSKQNLIRVLVKQNSSSKTKLQTQKNQILQYLQSAVCAHEADTVSMVTQLKHAITGEVEAFTGLSLPYLMFTVLDSAQKVAVINLSINRLSEPLLTSGNESVPRILELLKFPRFKSPEHLLQSVVDMKQLTDDLSDLVSEQPTGQTKDNTYTVEKISKLCREVARHDEASLAELLPSLQSRIQRATQALSDCIQVKDTTAIWWDQPAQSVVPWVKVDNRTLQQWKDSWTVAVTRLRQM